MFDTDTASLFRYCERKAASSLEPALGVGQFSDYRGPARRSPPALACTSSQHDSGEVCGNDTSITIRANAAAAATTVEKMHLKIIVRSSSY